MNKDIMLITEKLKLKDINPIAAETIAKEYGIDKEEVQLIRKGLTPADVKFEEGERAVISYITTNVVDRDKEIIDSKGAILKDYKKHPVVLFGHDYRSLPIGKNEWIKADDKGLIAKTVYANTPEADKVYKYRKDGFPLAESIGFIPLKITELNEEQAAENGGARRIYDKWILLEYSDVAVPSNPEATQIAIAKGLVEDRFNKLWEDKPTWTEIRYRLRDPNKFTRIRRMTLKKDKPRIFALVGPMTGETKTSLQALRFPKKDGWTLSKAKAWVAAHPEIKKELLILEPTIEELEVIVQEAQTEAVETFIKEGRVLSSKNRGLIKKCIDALEELYIATEPSKDNKDLTKESDTLNQIGQTLQGLIDNLK